MQTPNIGLSHRPVSQHQRAAIKIPGVLFFHERDVPCERPIGFTAALDARATRHEIQFTGEASRLLCRLGERHRQVEAHATQVRPHPHAQRGRSLGSTPGKEDIDCVIRPSAEPARKRETEILDNTLPGCRAGRMRNNPIVRFIRRRIHQINRYWLIQEAPAKRLTADQIFLDRDHSAQLGNWRIQPLDCQRAVVTTHARRKFECLCVQKRHLEIKCYRCVPGHAHAIQLAAENRANGAIRAEGTNRLQRPGRIRIDRQDRTPQIGNLYNGVDDSVAAVDRAIAIGKEPHVFQHDFKLADFGCRKLWQVFQGGIANACFDEHAPLAVVKRKLVQWPVKPCRAARNLAGHKRILKPGVELRLEDGLWYVTLRRVEVVNTPGAGKIDHGRVIAIDDYLDVTLALEHRVTNRDAIRQNRGSPATATPDHRPAGGIDIDWLV